MRAFLSAGNLAIAFLLVVVFWALFAWVTHPGNYIIPTNKMIVCLVVMVVGIALIWEILQHKADDDPVKEFFRRWF
jgi:membrane protein YdbS with pleckstrin-like domain